ncbi:MAG TPA: PilT/PilU family type 4a pilus ATPase [Candidatus Thiothrix moscowensis]|uniref:PilT/PilU family type 4a pilus ATPase n=1 Tax=unclassified Thiothrix TaxID=2636184 RepID=UPI0025CBB7F0|nr:MULTISPECIES: PilT/PilU family type 4a pilus ATPase [unclassified Thiothrix]HRJ51897.1 PilT/PilU family type 4a pilus ATPase [Candidatus Thiothrix moscowensis]HRJ92212.1 PilT/PilU family type 4a pilus ATPase [Candidatus Thiothrix moscowensis]
MTALTEADLRITPLLHMMVKQGASDLYLTTGAHASIKVRGQLRRISREPMKPGNIRQLAEEILTRSEIEAFFANRELNKGFSLKGVGRFRMNFYFQRGEVSMVIRHIRSDIRAPHELNLPEVLKDLVMRKEGLLLFVGSTGSGKSTSMASLIQFRNERHCGHILTIEDPIEYTFRHGQSIVGQREIGFDTLSYANAMREAMREAPDMIMVGEIRDTETMNAALGFADTGHLVLSTLHATNVIQALERILYLFPNEDKNRILMDLSLNLRGIVAQRLIPDEQDGLHLAAEVLINTPYVSELIRKGQFSDLKDVVVKGVSDGMQTFDQALYQLYTDNRISRAIALEYASSRNDLEWQINFGAGDNLQIAQEMPPITETAAVAEAVAA